MEKLKSQRLDILKTCRLEDIDLPLIHGSLENVPLDDTDNTSMDIDFQVDYSLLADEQKEVLFCLKLES